jgi:hypothetical protein
MSAPFLLPAPRELELAGAPLRLAAGAPLAPRVERDASLPPEGFALEIDARGARLTHADANGRRYGLAALDEIRAQSRGELPGLRLRDWPDFPARGYMLDISRDRVPTRRTLSRLVALLERVRMNQLQLYTEHTFAYRDHEEVWRDASPLSVDDVRWLDAACAARGIELVPNQNSFGHMERWLRHPRYRPLAETPDGWELPDGTRRAPTSLAPTPEALAFVRALHAELLPHFRSRSVNIGCDETWELGQGRSRAACEARGRGRVYWEFVSALVDGLRKQGRSVQIWGDIVGNHPELVPELPRDRLVTLVWGYEAPLDPAALPAETVALLERLGQPRETLRGFAPRVAPFAKHGVPFWVCPGTSSWNSLIGRWPNARANVLDAAESGLAAGARGFLLTDWGDNGHLQPWPISLPALVYGGAVAWCAEANRALDVEAALSRAVFRDATGELARALGELGGLYRETGLTTRNASPLFLALLAPGFGRIRAWGETSREKLERVHAALEQSLARVGRARPLADDGELCARELAQAARLARHGAWCLGRAYLERGPSDAELERDLRALCDTQRALWLARSRPGGLADSVARLERRLR